MIRHGQSQFNLENRFAGWVDTDLTQSGIAQAAAAGEALKKVGFVPDVVYVSPLTRTMRTAKIMFGDNASFVVDARLVERFYGDLSGKNKTQCLAEIGDEMFQKIRRGYETQPPAIKPDNNQIPAVNDVFNRLIKGTFTNEVPPTESLKDVETRVKPFFESALLPQLEQGKKVMIVAHGNSLRALIKLIKNIGPDQIAKVELETAQPTGFVVAGGKVTADSLGQHLLDWHGQYTGSIAS